MNSVPLLQGLRYMIRITPYRGGYVVGTLEDGGSVVFESEFPCYKDAYWALMEMDGNEFLSSQKMIENRPEKANHPTEENHVTRMKQGL